MNLFYQQQNNRTWLLQIKFILLEAKEGDLCH